MVFPPPVSPALGTNQPAKSVGQGTINLPAGQPHDPKAHAEKIAKSEQAHLQLLQAKNAYTPGVQAAPPAARAPIREVYHNREAFDAALGVKGTEELTLDNKRVFAGDAIAFKTLADGSIVRA